jgi:hypothetical protein
MTAAVVDAEEIGTNGGGGVLFFEEDITVAEDVVDRRPELMTDFREIERRGRWGHSG